ncbi:putative protease SohB [Pseudoalteromonas sp. THAF3]|uniref:protease SohB n=1 Tax=Pseudoalteromonas sp. THAF3 TaxID=2587843 RepID=UPI0012680D7C|nr:protease SohB [Pseudoalteromonas sp. THAF3]QFU05089.1 putative protease SohB [Pseudoalteromonas sp. THAF3]
MEYIYEYGLFFAKTLTFLVAIVIIIAMIAGAANKPKSKEGSLQVDDLSAKLKQLKDDFLANTLDKKALKALKKEQKKAAKSDSGETQQGRLYVIDFVGSMDAHEVESLREEVTAILTLADKQKDKVLVRLESGGGVVHGYGLAASQLARLKAAQIPLTIAIDKVAASGGYMMACVGDEIIAAPFAIVGSIGVVAQIPNFNKVLKKNDIDLELITAGQYKRTLTLFGENTDEGREKFRQEIEQTHQLFKHFVSEHRPELDLGTVATGEHWFAIDAKEKGLVDRITTSDDELLALSKERQAYKVSYKKKQGLADKVAHSLSLAVEKAGLKIWSKGQRLRP